MAHFFHPISKIVHLQPSHVIVSTPVVRVSRIPWKSTRSSPETVQNCRHLSRLNAPASFEVQGPWGYVHGIQHPPQPTCLRPPLQPPTKKCMPEETTFTFEEYRCAPMSSSPAQNHRHCHMFHHHDKDVLQVYAPFLKTTLKPLKLPLF